MTESEEKEALLAEVQSPAVGVSVTISGGTIYTMDLPTLRLFRDDMLRVTGRIHDGS